MSAAGFGMPQDAGTVPVHVQVIDVESFALDMVVPTYISASDLTQRVARDAGLGGYWPDGTRRQYYLRARGRILEDHEKLQDLGVVPHELLHLLPEPPPGSGVEERPPEYPVNRGYAGAGNGNVLLGLAAIGGWTALWSFALTYSQLPHVGLLPGVGLSLLCTSLARHLWGGLGSRVRIPATALALYFPLVALAPIPAIFVSGAGMYQLGIALAPAIVGGIIGVMLGWLAWYGAVEPLPKVTLKQMKAVESAVTYPCGICGGAVTGDAKVGCTYQCGRVFHEGCYRAKQAIGQGGGCAVCGYQPAAV